jgi:hypothetical protein
MADFLIFDEGANELLDNGYPSTIYLALSTRKVGTQAAGEHAVGDTLAGGFGEATGTGYSRKSQAEPAAASRAKALAQAIWNTGAAVDWPASVRSVVAVTSSGAGGKILWAMNLISGGAARDLSQANTEERVTPTHSLSSPA